MLAILILSLSFSIFGSDATVNEMLVAGLPTTPQNLLPLNHFNTEIKSTLNNPVNEMFVAGQSTVPQNLLPLNNLNLEINSTPNNPPPIQSQMAVNQQKGADCPNTAILLNILSILTRSLPQGDKNTIEPEKFNYVLTVVKNFLETVPLNPGNLDLYDKFKNLEVQLSKINYPVENELRAKFSLQNPLLGQRNQDCREILYNLINFINTAYSQALRYCLQTGKCNVNNGMNIPYNYNGIYYFNPYARMQQFSTSNISPVHENISKESVTAGTDLVNFIKYQEGKGVHDMMSILKNYRPGVTNISTKELKIPYYSVQNPTPYTNPQYNQIPNLYPSINEIYGQNPNLQPNNNFKPPNMNTMPWQTIFSGLKGLPGNNYENQQYVQLLKRNYEGNSLGVMSSIYPGIKTPLQYINGQVIPFNTGIPSTDPNKIIKAQVVMNKIPNFNDNTYLANMHQYLKLQPIQESINWSKKPLLPQQIMSSYVTYSQDQILNQNPANQPSLGVNNQLQYGLGFNPNGVGFNQISPLISVYNNGQNLFTDNMKQQGNVGGQLLDLNHLLGVANQDKLNLIPNRNGIVELTYALKRPKPAYDSQYYVKYRMPYQTFLYNLQNVWIKKPYLRSEPNKIYEEILVGSKVTDIPTDLKGLNHEDILKLTSANGTLVTAKILDNNDTAVDKTLKLVQKLNSKLPAESIINFNMSATKNLRFETQQNNVNGTQNSFGANNLLKSVYPRFSDVQRTLSPNLNYAYAPNVQYPQRLQYNSYSMDQAKPGLVNVGVPFLKYGSVLPNTNILKNPALYSPYYYLPRNHLQLPQLGR